jgi:hypothetical protein
MSGRQVELFYLGAIRFLAELHHAIFDFFWASADVDELKLLHVGHHASVSERIEDFQQVIFVQLESKEVLRILNVVLFLDAAERIARFSIKFFAADARP